jgi:hypothetical protein
MTHGVESGKLSDRAGLLARRLRGRAGPARRRGSGSQIDERSTNENDRHYRQYAGHGWPAGDIALVGDVLRQLVRLALLSVFRHRRAPQKKRKDQFVVPGCDESYVTGITEKQLKDAPAFSDDSWSDRSWEQRTYQHYNVTPHWA